MKRMKIDEATQPARRQIEERAMIKNSNNCPIQRSFLRKVFQATPGRFVVALTTVGLICCSVLVYVSANRSAGSSSVRSETRLTTTQPNPAVVARPPGKSNDHVSHSGLWSQLQDAFRALGDRLEKPGKERLTFTGTLEKSVNSQQFSFPFRMIWELPGRLHLEEFSGAQRQVTTFNGSAISKSGSSISQQDQDQVETLVYDSAEHFFIGRAQGQAMRYLGGGFTASGDDEKEPSHDLYEVVDQIRTTSEGREQIKHYYLNSETQLIEKVRYKLQRGGSTVAVEVQLNNWKTYQDQQFPTQIVRLENGVSVLTLTITTAGISPKTEDGLFAN